jgi:DNA-binding MarR family transcriptional regulator
MTNELQRELKQSKPFETLEQEAMLSIARTAAILDHAFAESLRPYGVTPTQYNVLRILRGAGHAGLCRGEVRERLVAQVPDVTRLLDRMQDAGLIERERDTGDRRLVTTRITSAGLALLDTLDAPVRESHARHLGHLTQSQLGSLIALLSQVRSAP